MNITNRKLTLLTNRTQVHTRMPQSERGQENTQLVPSDATCNSELCMGTGHPHSASADHGENESQLQATATLAQDLQTVQDHYPS